MVFLLFDEEEHYCPHLHHQHDNKMRKTKVIMIMLIMMIRCRQPLLNPLTLSCLRPPAKPSRCRHKFFTYLFPPTLGCISLSGLYAFQILALELFTHWHLQKDQLTFIAHFSLLLPVYLSSRPSQLAELSRGDFDPELFSHSP